MNLPLRRVTKTNAHAHKLITFQSTNEGMENENDKVKDISLSMKLL